MVKRMGANRKRSVIERKKKIGNKVKHSARGFFITILIVIGVCVLGYAGYRGYHFFTEYLEKSDYLNVKNVVVEGAVLSMADTIRVQSAIVPGMKLYAIAEKKITNMISKNIWIDKVEIKKRLDGMVYIRIKERKPIAVVNIKELQCVDRNGVLLPFNPGALLEMPLFSGVKDSTDTLGRHILVEKDMAKLLKFIDETKNINDLNTMVSQVDLSKNDRIRLSCRSSKVLVEIDPDNIAESINRLSFIEPILKTENGKPALINMIYQDLAFVIQEETAKEEVLKRVND